MYVATIEMQIKTVKGNPLVEDKRIEEVIEKNILGTMKEKMEQKFAEDEISADVDTIVQWLPEKKG